MRRTRQLSTRRDFLTTASLALAGTVLSARQLQAGVPVLLPARSPLPVDAFLPESNSASDLRSLATQAIDAAKSAGASYADVRVSMRHRLYIGQMFSFSLDTKVSYGVRTLVDGSWGFAFGRESTSDAIVRCARQAVSVSRVSAHCASGLSGAGGPVDPAWVPAPVVTGEWRTPVAIDPFSVPVQKHVEFVTALQSMLGHTPEMAFGGDIGYWTRETRVFAATTGSMVTQYLNRAEPNGKVLNQTEYVWNAGMIPELHSASGGYELFRNPIIMDHAKEAKEELALFSRLPRRPLDVGRYPIALDGYVMGTLLATMVGPSAELDRVLGYEAEASGTSRWTQNLLGTPVASPLLTVKGHRKLPSITAVQWDDEGVVPKEHTVIRDGVLIDYHTSGQTVSALAPWYKQRGQELRSNGCATAPDAECAVTVRPPHLTMTPSQTRMSLEDLYKDMKKGIAVINSGLISSDQQMSSGSFSTGSQLVEISQGKIVSRISGNSLQFTTRSFLNGLTAVGDHTTVAQADVKTTKGMPWIEYPHSATAPAALFKEINVISSRV